MWRSRLGERISRIMNSQVPNNVQLNAGSKKKPLFDRLKNNKMLGNLNAVMGRLQLTAPIHAIDSIITYLMGLASGLEDMAQAIDAPNCKMPDYYISKAPTCACGDDPVRIAEARRNEGLAEHAHWCTGTLQMQDGFGNPIYVFNPFSYSRLRSLAPAGSIDR